MNNWQKFWQLTPQERHVFLLAVMLTPLVKLGLHALGWQRLMRLLERSGSSRAQHPPAPQTHDYVRRTAYIVNAAASRRLVRGTCLQRSIVLWWLLQCDGIETRLMLGSRKEQGRFQAHAWVEHEGEIINDRSEIREEFAAFEQA